MAFNPPNPGLFQQQISTAIVNVRDSLQAIVNINNYLASVGGASFLETLGLDSADAETVVSALGNHAALAAIYNGGAPGAALNYYANGEPLWSGQ